MTTLIISSIIALLVITGLLWAATRVGKWIHRQELRKRTFNESDGTIFTLSERQLQEINAQLKPRVYMNGKFIGFLESDDERGQKLVDEAKEILKQKQP